ncbi:trigger factor Tig [Mycobacterium tuberculosis]|uniref:Trigger factor n=11 Tax=Mycobacterium tuberculosis TaxID=1773 RepID=TIG_MYCTU|nr:MULTISPECIES: trigger factor [Mycobacterium]NP_216978.1 trigger factor [Mycobacterium tuberculosis H37Rv]A5U5F8.1 RecName: Full=Trigger factor; Short=TF; AltName: Full=PPIase [Mycobacterium tuberculosis H37Ra]P9WG54.1 RecName: Full=Trigger factor; Short=TF; AltName: Full=PPIase [Mycobacterium tuberculosis CDC1551]P9WG55.1 RecName: Full=Trigger factor; Short=TF; AltName: Full=PPIase [Mycobacterium tuberculosis H37Rv]AGJ68555.1 trigger factor [Mycobacterium tuberculosis str. Beijing/NITR203]
MKSTVEQLSPTRVRINVEVPFAELEPDFQRAYKELAKQVRLPGFRPGKAPAKLLEARIGREAMLDQIVNDALPSRYGQAVAESDVQPLGRPNIEVTKKEYGQDLQFTAEVDIRPKISPPDLSALTVSVDPIEIGEDDVDAELQSLRTRFGTLTAVDRPVAVGDVVSIDLSATVDGEDIPNAAAEGLSHEVGSGRLIAGLDDAVVGLSADESRVFTAKLAAGEHAGQEAQVTVTVRSVKERELPEPDDEFAQLASEFDSIDELRASLSDQVRQAKRAQQAEQIRNATIDALLEQVDVPLPESYVQAQFDSVLHSALSGLNHDEARFNELLVEQGSSRAAFDAEARTASEKDVKRQLLLDALADELQVQVGQDDLTERLVTTSRQYGIEPQQLFGYLQERNQLPTMFADVRRELAIRAAVEAATVTDSDGNTIDTSEFFGKRVSAGEAEEAEPADEGAARAASDEATT